MTSRQYVSWDACSNHSAISDLFNPYLTDHVTVPLIGKHTWVILYPNGKYVTVKHADSLNRLDTVYHSTRYPTSLHCKRVYIYTDIQYVKRNWFFDTCLMTGSLLILRERFPIINYLEKASHELAGPKSYSLKGWLCRPRSSLVLSELITAWYEEHLMELGLVVSFVPLYVVIFIL